MWSFFSRDPVRDFAYDFGEGVEQLEGCSLWQLNQGTKKGTDNRVSLFSVRSVREGDSSLSLAKSALKRYKTLRHPSIIRYVDSLETDGAVFLVTEPVTPLHVWLQSQSLTAEQRRIAITWGLLHISRVLAFLSDTCQLSHNNVNISSVFVDQAAEWKLAGMEFVGAAESYSPEKQLSSLRVYDPPEGVGRRPASHHCDSWGMGCLIWESFNGRLTDSTQLRSLRKVDDSIRALCSRLLAVDPQHRPALSSVVDSPETSCFRSELVNTLISLEELQVKDTTQKERYIGRLTPLLDRFPVDLCKYKILPQLVAVFDFGGCGPAILPPIFKLGNLLSEHEYQLRVVPCLVKLFSSNDRHTRVQLLQQLDSFVEHLQPSTVNDQVFPHLVGGFLDSSAVLREHTVRACVLLAPKLNTHNLNVELLKYLARLQAKDEEGGIRTNTTVCIAKLAEHLAPDVRQKVLRSAFVRALRDPFAPSRSAGIRGLASTVAFYPLSEVAERVLPSLCPLTADSELSVRQLAFSTISAMLQRLQTVSDRPELRESMEADVNKKSSGCAGSWAGWAVDAITSVYQKRSGAGNSSNNNSSSGGGSNSNNNSSSGSNSSNNNSSGGGSNNNSNSSGGSSSATTATAKTDTKSAGDSIVSEKSSSSCISSVTQSQDGQLKRCVSTESSTTSPPSRQSSHSQADGWEQEEWDALEEPTQVACVTVRQDSAPLGHSRQEPSHSATDGWDDMDDWGTDNGERRVPLPRAATVLSTTKLERKHGSSQAVQTRTSRSGPLRLGAKKL